MKVKLGEEDIAVNEGMPCVCVSSLEVRELGIG